MEANEKHYFAFISHSSKDEKTAFWLRDKLEKYHIPTKVQNDESNEFKGRKRLKPCFVYQTDLAGRDLEQSLRKELSDSQYLVVLCSPESAKAIWVNREIRKFVEAGLTDRIIPCIIRGEYEESMPDAVKELAEGKLYDEKTNTFKDVKAVVRRGLDFIKIEKDNNSKEAPVMNLIATMLGVRFDVIWDRYLLKRRRRKLTASSAILLLVLLGLFLWDYNRSSYAYFEDYVDCWGRPEGIMSLTKEQAKMRNTCCEFEYKRARIGEPDAYSWRLSKVRCKNSETGMGYTQKRYPLLEIGYIKGSNTIHRIDYCSNGGMVLFRHKYSEHNGVPACIVDIENAHENLGASASNATIVGEKVYDKENNNRIKRPNIVRYVLKRDEAGHVICQTYHANNDYNFTRSSICNADGIFGCKYQLDSVGRIVKVEYLGLDGEKTCTHDGISYRIYQYDSCGRVNRVTYYDLNDSLIYKDYRFCSSSVRYDQNGNIYECCYYGADGLPCFNSDGFHKVLWSHNEKGDVVEEAYFGIDGLPCFDENGYHKVKWKYSYSRNGKEIMFSFFNIQDKPCNDYNGVSVGLITEDVFGNTLDVRYFDKDRVPVKGSDGFFKKESKYDLQGNLIQERYYDEQEDPCACNSGYAIWTAKYDKRNNLIGIAYFDINGRPCMCNGYAKWTAKYDERGNRIESSYYDTIGNLCFNNLGYATWKCVFDEQGNGIQGSYYGPDGNLCVHSAGNSYNKTKYDAHGNHIEQCYYDKNGNLCMTTSGFAKWTSKYDVFGNMVETTCYDANDSLCICSEGFCIKRCKYDNRNRQIEEAYYDTKGKLCYALGCAKWVAKYDNRGNKTEIAYYGDDDRIESKTTKGYDKYGRLVEEQFWDANEINGCGCAKRSFIYHDEENYTEFFIYDTEGDVLEHDTVRSAKLLRKLTEL